MADKDGEEKNSGASRIGGFASSLGQQQKYIVVNLDSLEYDKKYKTMGATRYLPWMVSHELLHTLGFSHPKNHAKPGEAIDARTWDEIRQDVAANITSENALGKLDKATGLRVITYSFVGDHKRIIHSPGMIIDGFRNLGDTKSAEANEQNKLIKATMLEAFAEQSRQLGVVFKETNDPSIANIQVFTGTIAPSSDASVSLNGGQNPLTADSTIMSYNMVDKIYPISAPGDTNAGQLIYGLPPDDPTQRIITPERLAHHAGVFWHREPMAIKLTQSPMIGALTIDMGAKAPPFTPAITGALIDAEGEKKVRWHIGPNASINELDATGSNITLDVIGGLGAHITPNKNASVKLKGRNNALMLGAGNDSITFLNGFGNSAAGLTDSDTIGAKDAKKVRLQYWSDKEVGTLMTFIGNDGAQTGSLFVKDKKPEELKKLMKGLVVTDAAVVIADVATTTLDALDLDVALSGTPGSIGFSETKDIMLTAKKADGFTLRNVNGAIAIKMTKAEYDSRSVKSIDDSSYSMSFNDGDKVRKIIVQKNAKIAITGADGKITRAVPVTALREALAGIGKGKDIEKNAIDKDKEMEKAPEAVSFKEDKDVIITAQRASGHIVGNMGKGDVVIKMTQPEYESRTIIPITNGYKISFRDGEGIKEFRFQATSKIAITGPDGKIERVVGVNDAQKEFELDLALKKSKQEPSKDDSSLASLPYKLNLFTGQNI